MCKLKQRNSLIALVLMLGLPLLVVLGAHLTDPGLTYHELQATHFYAMLLIGGFGSIIYLSISILNRLRH